MKEKYVGDWKNKYLPIIGVIIIILVTIFREGILSNIRNKPFEAILRLMGATVAIILTIWILNLIFKKPQKEINFKAEIKKEEKKRGRDVFEAKGLKP